MRTGEDTLHPRSVPMPASGSRMGVPCFKDLRARPDRMRAFTLVELLVAIAIGLIILGLAVPVLREIKRPPLTQATKDLLDACVHARARAIMEGRPTQLVIRDGGASIAVEAAPEGVVGATNGVSIALADPDGPATGGRPTFTRTIDDRDVAFEAVNVNQRSFMDSPATAVRFFPNGTADEFEVVVAWRRSEARRITIEPMTGLAVAVDVR